MAFRKLYMLVNLMDTRALGMLGRRPGAVLAICYMPGIYVIYQAVGMDIKLLSYIQKRFTHFQWQAVLVAEALLG